MERKKRRKEGMKEGRKDRWMWEDVYDLGQHIFEGNAASRLPQTFENFSIGSGTTPELKDERPGRKLA
ncbi:hypothetical protein V1478_011426 [Vespula squamosa]|uniref:Uncharacterized protein n=1 Tax=Vespula squamosa TaxID=30214 RepID=A0ABD2AEG9_VESSQ